MIGKLILCLGIGVFLNGLWLLKDMDDYEEVYTISRNLFIIGFILFVIGLFI